MNITDALVKRLAKLPSKDQQQILQDNPATNFSLLAQKCTQLSEDLKDDTSGIAEKLEDLRFLANCFHVKQQKGADTVELSIT